MSAPVCNICGVAYAEQVRGLNPCWSCGDASFARRRETDKERERREAMGSDKGESDRRALGLVPCGKPSPSGPCVQLAGHEARTLEPCFGERDRWGPTQMTREQQGKTRAMQDAATWRRQRAWEKSR